MKDHDDLFSPDGIDEQIAQHQPARSEPTPGDRLVHDLQQLALSEQQLDSHSLEHVWQQVQAKRMLAPTSTQGNRHEQHVLSQAKRPEMKIIGIKEKQAMEDNFADGSMNSAASLPQTKKRRSLARIVGSVLVAAVALIMILSFTVFSGILRTAPVATGKKPSTITGAPGKGSSTTTSSPSQQQIAISHGTSVCSFRTDPNFVPNNSEPSNVIWNPYISWSSQGEVAVTDFASVRAYSAQNCASAALSQSSIHPASGASWSPDGKKLLVGNPGDNSADVLDSQGNIITRFSNVDMSAGNVWSPDSTKITLAAIGSQQQLNLVQSIDLSNGNNVTTLLTLPYNSFIRQISYDGKIALVEKAAPGGKSKPLTPSIWDITSGQKISDLPSTLSNSLATFSPDGSLWAVSVPGALQIYTTANGHLLTSIADTSSANTVQTLAWSPNGTYLAESTNAIKIYNIAAKKLVTTFGAVDAQHRVVNLAWAPDNTGIASTTMELTANGVPANNHTIVNVWKLS